MCSSCYCEMFALLLMLTLSYFIDKVILLILHSIVEYSIVRYFIAAKYFQFSISAFIFLSSIETAGRIRSTRREKNDDTHFLHEGPKGITLGLF